VGRIIPDCLGVNPHPLHLANREPLNIPLGSNNEFTS
jgi:hypothetical protein